MFENPNIWIPDHMEALKHLAVSAWSPFTHSSTMWTSGMRPVDMVSLPPPHFVCACACERASERASERWQKITE